MAELPQWLKDKFFKWEGGYQCFPDDVANYNSRHELVGTNMGVGALSYEFLLGRVVTKDDMLNMNKTVPELLMEKYWDIVQGHRLQNLSIASFLFDWFWASGYYGISWFTGVLKVRLNIPLKVDYHFETWEADIVNAYPDQKQLFDVLMDERLKFIKYIIRQNVLHYLQKCKAQNIVPSNLQIFNNTYERFEKGWTNRIKEYKYEASN